MTYRKIFSYYGGKSKIAHKYPKPDHDIVVEPFAGGAAYSLLYAERDIVLNEKNPVTLSVWQWLISSTALDDLYRFVPTICPQGIRVEDFLNPQAPTGLVNLVRAEFNRGTLGAKGVHAVATKWASRDWHQVHKRLEYWIPRIAHWVVVSGDYRSLPDDLVATWFVDPPYNNAAGGRYAVNDVNYAQLARWCWTRKGTVIVCENDEATWLPFEPLCVRAGCYTGRDSRVAASGVEAVYIRR